MIKTCANCGSLFAAKRKNVIYCSEKCAREASKKRCRDRYNAPKPLSEPRICPLCGTEYYPRNGNQVYCSEECRNTADDNRQREHWSLHKRQEKIELEQQRADHEKRLKEKDRRFDDILRAAEAEGLSYGQYIIRQRMKQQKGETHV